MAALENKIDFAIAFEVNNANPNGDPLNGNRPRTTSEGLGEVSDVALKRKIATVCRMQENQSLYSLMIVPMMVPNRCRTGSIHI